MSYSEASLTVLLFFIMQTYHAIVEWAKEVTKRVWVAKLKLYLPPTMEFLAGQYCSFTIDKNIRRTFSITTPPSQKDAFEICADVTPMGPGSVWLMNLKPGDRVEFLGPMGKFTVDRESKRNRVFISTGTGIAPIRSMVYESLSTNNKQQTTNNKEVNLFWGLRYEDDIFWNEKFEEIAIAHKHFIYTLTLSQPSERWTGKRGYVTEHLNILENLSSYDYHLCGNRGTIDSIKEFLLSQGVPSYQIKSELFF